MVAANLDQNWDLYAINDVGMINEPNTIFWNDGESLIGEQDGKGAICSYVWDGGCTS